MLRISGDQNTQKTSNTVTRMKGKYRANNKYSKHPEKLTKKLYGNRLVVLVSWSPESAMKSNSNFDDAFATAV